MIIINSKDESIIIWLQKDGRQAGGRVGRQAAIRPSFAR